MLKSLLIENYALIEKLDISFDSGLTIITGETGAGKSILLGALGMILGQRADTRVLLDQEKKCIIEGTFHIQNLNLKGFFEQNELDYDPVAIFRREITPQGKSRAFINDTPVNLPVMKELAEKLIDIHSQHQNLVVGQSDFRFQVLDAFASNAELLSAYQIQYQELARVNRTLLQLQEQEKQVRTDLDYFRFQYDELFKAALSEDEFGELESELEILSHAAEIRNNLEKADFLLQSQPGNTLSLLAETAQLFRSLTRFSNSFEELFQRLQSAEIELKDIAMEVSRRKEDIADDPRRQMELQQRYDLLQKLMHKHNAADMSELISIREDYFLKINGFESLEEEIARLQLQSNSIREKLVVQAGAISERRKKAVPKLENQICALLKELGMPNARFVVKQTPTPDVTPRGSDELEFLFSANLGAQPQNLEKVASGGELSRLMLAIKSVISMKNLLPTIIFDEIDTGVSGEIGFKMGTILEKIGQSMQVISITHLPQVAAKGDRHFIVYKKTENKHTKTLVRRVDTQERVVEIAKMLGGDNPSSSVLQAAQELIQKQSIHKN
ncbi:MAG: DNA repair protein RecN [Bacteroidales bacterium]